MTKVNVMVEKVEVYLKLGCPFLPRGVFLVTNVSRVERNLEFQEVSFLLPLNIQFGSTWNLVTA